MVQVTISDGIIEGELLDNEYGGQYYSFKGIPYAEPPLGDLRFKEPQPVKPWMGVLETKKFRDRSYQRPNFTDTEPRGSEDCLYLNVYTPDLKPTKLKAVMILIHGGAFIFGGGDDELHGPEFLIRRDIILVTINYRLGALGFLCLHTKDIPGNAGMKDQVAAMRWVKNNIKHFGGDSGNVTLFGESAGAISISYHLVSPMSKGLFKRAIVQSGAITCRNTNPFQPRERALTLARKLGCYSENDKDLYEFFKSLPLKSFVGLNVSNTFFEAHKEWPFIFFYVVSEQNFGENERFFCGDVYDALRNGIHEGVDVLTGYTEEEGYVALSGRNVDRVIFQLNNFNDFLVPNAIARNCHLGKQLEIANKIRKFYFKNQGREFNMTDFNDYIKYCSMVIISFAVTEWAKICAGSNKNKIYFYVFTCKSERNLQKAVLGLSEVLGDKVIVSHADDTFYLYPAKGVEPKTVTNPNTLSMIERFTKLLTNFAKYGNPTPDESLDVQWLPYSVEKQDYLDIGNHLVARTEPNKEEIEFWESIWREYHESLVK